MSEHISEHMSEHKVTVHIPSKEYVKLYMFFMSVIAVVAVMFGYADIEDIFNPILWGSVIPILLMWAAFK